VLSTNGNKAYFVYSWSGSAYRSGLTGSMTYDKTVLPEVSGAGVSQDVIEVLMGETGRAVVSQDVIEVLVSGDGYVPTTGGGKHGSVSFG
jgi:hypothetical protein